MSKNDNSIDNFQKTEVSKIKWMHFKDCIEIIRPYNLERIDTLTKVNTILTKYKFF